jgi:ADP-ribose pyrophosphatase YjhB (NUDIX family)
MALNPVRLPAPSRPASNQSSGPALLVLTQIFAQNHILLLKRGLEPYRGKWAPPGGFVEHGEASQAAAIREVWEEVRVRLEPGQLQRQSIVDVPQLNQRYHIYTAHLTVRVPASAVAPECLQVGWFSQRDLSRIAVWDPGLFGIGAPPVGGPTALFRQKIR